MRRVAGFLATTPGLTWISSSSAASNTSARPAPAAPLLDLVEQHGSGVARQRSGAGAGDGGCDQHQGDEASPVCIESISPDGKALTEGRWRTPANQACAFCAKKRGTGARACRDLTRGYASVGADAWIPRGTGTVSERDDEPTSVVQRVAVVGPDPGLRNGRTPASSCHLGVRARRRPPIRASRTARGPRGPPQPWDQPTRDDLGRPVMPRPCHRSLDRRSARARRAVVMVTAYDCRRAEADAAGVTWGSSATRWRWWPRPRGHPRRHHGTEAAPT